VPVIKVSGWRLLRPKRQGRDDEGAERAHNDVFWRSLVNYWGGEGVKGLRKKGEKCKITRVGSFF